MIAYTFSQSLDQASSISDPVDPFNFRPTRALSAWDLTHNFVATYQYQLPPDRISAHAKSLTLGWTISGITRTSTGFPVDISSDGDNLLTGSLPNGRKQYILDRPDYTPGPPAILSALRIQVDSVPPGSIQYVQPHASYSGR
jgi:hypothetical protein